MGEIIRSSFSKRMAKRYAAPIRRAMAEEHQWGISIPGACEALSHWRSTVEDLAREGALGPIVVADVDQVNMFGNAEWDSIRSSIDCSFREILRWTEWSHEKPGEVVLPSGEHVCMNRGAGQGDAFGSYQARPHKHKAEAAGLGNHLVCGSKEHVTSDTLMTDS